MWLSLAMTRVLFSVVSAYTEWWGAGVVVCLEQGADLHMAQLMSLPLTVSCFSKIQIGVTFLVSADLGSPGKRAVKRVCVCISAYTCASLKGKRLELSTPKSVELRSMAGPARVLILRSKGQWMAERLGSACRCSCTFVCCVQNRPCSMCRW